MNENVTFDDGPLTFEIRSSDEDDTWDGIPLSKLPPHTVVPSHVGLPGNDVADALAKASTSDLVDPSVQVDISMIVEVPGGSEYCFSKDSRSPRRVMTPPGERALQF
ncbi:hypothetical protein TNCV_2127361 [Trichonephila clavipes]|nr:hypothetical protein TNCV_2127361 [Trichonephila clavipes]